MARQSLLLVFEESILPTHRSKFVQFVLFFASGRAHGLGYALTSKLIDVLRDDMKPKVIWLVESNPIESTAISMSRLSLSLLLLFLF